MAENAKSLQTGRNQSKVSEPRLIDANKLPYYPVSVGTLVVFKDDIENAPTVGAVKVVHGRWVETKNGFHCSKCKRKPGQHPTKQGAYLSSYCPSCGAEMLLGGK